MVAGGHYDLIILEVEMMEKNTEYIVRIIREKNLFLLCFLFLLYPAVDLQEIMGKI